MSLNIDETLIQAEKEALRLQQQMEQEAAMKVVLPLRFEQNMVAFRQYIPHIAEIYETYQPARPFNIFCTENGQPNLVWLDDNVAVYGDEPYLICETLVRDFMDNSTLSRLSFREEENTLGSIHVEYLNKLNIYKREISSQADLLANIPDEIPSALIFGVGLGYHLGYIYERCKIGTLFLFEPDMDLFYASLFCFDWTPLLAYMHQENLGLHILLGQDEYSIVKDFSSAIRKRGAFLVANPLIMWGYQNEKINGMIDKIIQEYYLLVMGWGFFDDNLMALSHSIRNIERGIPFLKKELKLSSVHKDVPVFIIGNGPSLDESIDVINAHKEHAILISCGSAITALHKNGIKPDILVQVERTKSIYDFMVNLDEPEYLKDVLFFSTDVIHPNCPTLFKNTVLAFKSGEPGSVFCNTYFPASTEFATLGAVNPLVGNLGVSAPIHLGFKNLYMFGLDNGYKDKEHHHSKSSAYYNSEENAKILGAMLYSANERQCEANFGGVVISNTMYDTSRYMIEQVLAGNMDVHCFNCSDGAKIAGAKPLPSHRVSLHQKIDKASILNEIRTKLCAPLTLSTQDYHGFLDVDFFNYLIDKIIDEWGQEFSSRNEINQLMLKHFSYLDQIAETKQRLITQMLSGSMNYMFTLLSATLYSCEEEGKSLHLMKPAVSLWIEFLQKAREMYPNAFDSVDMVYDETINLYKRT
ncbi:6-hydroxymethylpterin diphosphokinase MptE-like protein [Aeromonas caviae]|uniref:motility associated factor glycosyltransferase family protein n=1 Tax=Aeromonas caviae TaxID=648 RepID=UPI00191FFC9C|nr:6-hydroxymethylpterin diphosphokinase MptE-like protein [Aeromonas caviae]MBL0646012.1 motility associated factor glycosyltransferase family protein [Aeromonas caviae]